MASITADELVVKIRADMSDLNRSLKNLEAQTGRTEKRVNSSFKAIGVGFRTALASVVVAQVARAGNALITLASDVEEMRGKSSVVFGRFADETRAELAKFADEVGRSRFELEGMAASIQDTFVPMGFARGAAAELSIELTKLATDVASFNNANDAEVMAAFQSALVGNHETMRQFGVVITQATLDLELLKMGIDGGVKSATEQEKVQARLNMIIAGTSDAHNDAARTSDSYANQTRALKADLEVLGAMVGETLKQRFVDLFPVLDTAIEKFTKFALSIGLITKYTDDVKGVTDQINDLTARISELQSLPEQNIFEKFLFNNELSLEMTQRTLESRVADQQKLLNDAAKEELRLNLVQYGMSRQAFKTHHEAQLLQAQNAADEEQEIRARFYITASAAQEVFARESLSKARLDAVQRLRIHNEVMANLREQGISQVAIDAPSLAVAEGGTSGSRSTRAAFARQRAAQKRAEELANATTKISSASGDLKTVDTTLPEISPELKRIESSAKAMGDSFGRAFNDVAKGTKTASQAFTQMAASINDSLFDIYVTKRITGFITDTVSFLAGGSSFTGPLSIDFSQLMGGGSSSGGSSALRPRASPFRGSAGGGGIYGPTVVGERGPELFIPNSAGRIMNNSASRSAMRNNTPSIVQNINISTGVQQTVRSEIQTLLPRIAEASKAAVSESARRGGSYKGSFA